MAQSTAKWDECDAAKLSIKKLRLKVKTKLFSLIVSV